MYQSEIEADKPKNLNWEEFRIILAFNIAFFKTFNFLFCNFLISKFKFNVLKEAVRLKKSTNGLKYLKNISLIKKLSVNLFHVMFDLIVFA